MSAKKHVMVVCGGIGDLMARLHAWEGRFWPAGGEDVELLMTTTEPKACEEIAADWGGFSGVRFVGDASLDWDSVSRTRELWSKHGRDRVPFWEGDWVPPTLKQCRFVDLGKWDKSIRLPEFSDFPSFVTFSEDDVSAARAALSAARGRRMIAVHPFPHSFSRGLQNDFWAGVFEQAALSGGIVVVFGGARERDPLALARAAEDEKYGDERGAAMGTAALMTSLVEAYGAIDLRGELSLRRAACALRECDFRVLADSCLKEYAWDSRTPSVLVEADTAQTHAEMLDTFFWGVRTPQLRAATRGELLRCSFGPRRGEASLDLDGWFSVTIRANSLEASHHSLERSSVSELVWREEERVTL